MKIVRRESKLPNSKLNTSLDLLQRVYNNRGVVDNHELDYELKQLIPYHSLKEIDSAIQLLWQALKQQQRILVIGDFDADGATSTALMVSALKRFGAKQIEFLVPNRFEYGYGLTPEIVTVASRWQPDLIITVDNGISSINGVTSAHDLGIKVLITDHHLPGSEIPDADAIVNPNQPGCEFPSKNLCGVGVAFYVLSAFRNYLREKNWFQEQAITEPKMAEFLDLVALGTVADVVPLDHNNRILVHQGIRRIRAGFCRPGIKALLQIGNRKPANIVAADLGFAIGPRLNAAGRLDDMSLGIECLLSDDEKHARKIAKQLDELNQERKAIEQDMQQQAYSVLNTLKTQSEQQLPFGLCVFEQTWHQGVIGILASRLKDKYHRPVIAFACADDMNIIKGSARSVSGVHIRDVLDSIASKHPNLISKFGGHAMAAGLSLAKDNYQAFATAFDQEVRKHITNDDLHGTIHTDGELTTDEITLTIAEQVQAAGPWGQAFPEPCFDGVFTVRDQRLVGGKHLKLSVQIPQSEHLVEAIAFNVDLNQWPNHRLTEVQMVYRLDVNEYQGWRRLQLMVEYLLPYNK